MQEIITFESRNDVPTLAPVQFTHQPRQGVAMTTPDGAALTWLLRGIQGYALCENSTLWQLPCVESDGTSHDWVPVSFAPDAHGVPHANLRLPQGGAMRYTSRQLRDRIFLNVAHRDRVEVNWSNRLEDVVTKMASRRVPEPAAAPPKRLRRARRTTTCSNCSLCR